MLKRSMGMITRAGALTCRRLISLNQSNAVRLVVCSPRPSNLNTFAGSRPFSVGAARTDILTKQAQEVLKKAKEAEEMIFDHHNPWNDLDAYLLDEIVAATGFCRDFVNSLSTEEEAVIQKATGAVSRTEEVEDLLLTVLKCDELGERVKKLRMIVEDAGTRGDGDCKPGAFRKEWDVETDKLFNEYSELLEKSNVKYINRIEKELGYQFLLYKRILHIESFRFYFPKVHPTGFSASSD